MYIVTYVKTKNNESHACYFITAMESRIVGLIEDMREIAEREGYIVDNFTPYECGDAGETYYETPPSITVYYKD